MAQFQQMVLDYLEHYEPERYVQLKRTRRLRSAVNALVECMYDEAERIKVQLREANPDMSDEQISIEAEELAIAQFLPMPDGESNTWEA